MTRGSREYPGSAGWAAQCVLIAAACNIAGWLLSMMGWVTPLGLALSIPPIWFGLHVLCQAGCPAVPGKRAFRRFFRGNGKGLRLAFAVVAGLSLLGGLLHAPNNYDAMNYRLPKVAGWLMEGGWQWFPANYNNLNTRASGMEWVFAPLMSWTGGDRVLFLTNQLPFLLMPGLVFGVFRGLGVAGRAARFWMWVVPCGYGFALQAGGIGNDLQASLFVLAAFDFALRWKKSGRVGHALLALAAAGMMTAVKPTTLPLMLPFTVLFFGMFGLLKTNPLRVAAAVVPLALASFLPTAILNHRYCGDWTGAAAENAALGKVEPWIGITGNLINAPLQNIAPPLLPIAGWWNERVVRWFPEPFLERMAANFETRGARFGLTDIQGEESAGLGIGIVAMCVAGACFGRRRENPKPWKRRAGWLALWFGVALLAYFSKAGMTTVARHILPYYPFLMVPLVMMPRLEGVVRKRWFEYLAYAAVASTAVMLCITPSRPVLPMAAVSRALAEKKPSPTFERLALGYEVYGNRADILGPVREALPEDAVLVGYIDHGYAPESSLWKPYGKRTIRHLLPGNDPGAAMSHVVLNTFNFEANRGESPEKWLARLGGTILARREIRPLVKEPASEWWVVSLPSSDQR
ncbi:MAG: hypothetical protein RLZZ505_2972 [Verrucomicrobiota bacterium]